MPGGLVELREAVARIQEQGTRVFVDYNPWDTGTRREGKFDLDVLVELVAALRVDGSFLGTMAHGAAARRDRLDAVRPGVIPEGEAALLLERLHDHHASWAQGFADSPVSGVLRDRGVERRDMQHLTRRRDRDHSGEIHTAGMNGAGMRIRENVFASWMGYSGRDRSVL